MVETYRARSTSTNTLPNTALERRRGKRGVPLSLSIKSESQGPRWCKMCVSGPLFTPISDATGLPSQPPRRFVG